MVIICFSSIVLTATDKFNDYKVSIVLISSLLLYFGWYMLRKVSMIMKIMIIVMMMMMIIVVVVVVVVLSIENKRPTLSSCKKVQKCVYYKVL